MASQREASQGLHPRLPQPGDRQGDPLRGLRHRRQRGVRQRRDHGETAQLAVASIKAWWEDLGRERYPTATSLQITADCGGGNGNRVRLWKTELQRLAEDTGLEICVCHFPPGTSKWNKIEHRLFCHISQSWRGRPLVNYAVVINSIAATRTSTGLKVYARLDKREYPKKVEITDDQIAAVNLTADAFHPEWNYVISPSHTHAG